MITGVSELARIVRENKAGGQRGIYSVCSAHEGVIRASMKQARADDSMLLVESTSNQVDQFGGYTGMTPEDFAAFLGRIAGDEGFPRERLLLGGDHLGPNARRHLNSREAMDYARELIRRYVAAGYGKIHLDCSMHLADDGGSRREPLPDEVVSRRAAELCAEAEKTWAALSPGGPPPLYIIGTEVPVPGGAAHGEEEEAPGPTPAADAEETLRVTREAFMRAGLREAWERVCGLVVQPGVEFGDDRVFDYSPEAAGDLAGVLDKVPHMVFEVHSTDYQRESSLRALVAGHFCIQKVGPWLTYAWREALFALAAVENEVVEKAESSRLEEVLEAAMTANPEYWEKYYSGSPEERRLRRKYSYSDRSRYYWPRPEVRAAVERLFANIRRASPSPTLFSQYLPAEYEAWREGRVNLEPREIAEYHVRLVLQRYSRACGMDSERSLEQLP